MEVMTDLVDPIGEMSENDGLSSFFRRTPVALYRSNPSGELLEANAALARLLGYEDVEELRAKMATVESLYVDPDQRTDWLEAIARTGVVYDFDIQLRRSDGTTIWVQDTARAVRNEDGEIIYFEGALIDVTEKVTAHKAKDELVATISHELRNPIAVILGLSEELAQNYDSFDDDDRREMAGLISRQADDAAWLIEDLLVAYRDDVSRVPVSIQRFDVSMEAQRVLEVIEHPIKVEVHGGEPLVNADPRRSRQIMRNLVSNALRYGGEEVVIRIGLSGDRVEVEVCDSGPAIDPAEVERIFKPFERSRSNDHTKSVGLGLAVARRLARLMGGDLTYRHTGGYSRFVLSLPAG